MTSIRARCAALIDATTLRSTLGGMAGGYTHFAYMLGPRCAIRMAAEALWLYHANRDANMAQGRDPDVYSRKRLRRAIALLDTAAERMWDEVYAPEQREAAE